jgi:hypothetical protein
MCWYYMPFSFCTCRKWLRKTSNFLTCSYVFNIFALFAYISIFFYTLQSSLLRWFAAEDHTQEILDWVATNNFQRDIHMLDCFGFSQSMAFLGCQKPFSKSARTIEESGRISCFSILFVIVWYYIILYDIIKNFNYSILFKKLNNTIN